MHTQYSPVKHIHTVLCDRQKQTFLSLSPVITSHSPATLPKSGYVVTGSIPVAFPRNGQPVRLFSKIWLFLFLVHLILTNNWSTTYAI